MVLDLLSPDCLLAFWMPSGGEWIILLIVGLLIFGRRLPEVGRWLGQGIVEFKKGVKGLSDEIEDATNDKSGGRGGAGDRLADQSSNQSSFRTESAPKQTVERAES